MKFIHIADLHIDDKHRYSVDGSRLLEIKRNLMLTVKYAILNKIPLIIIAGDIFDVYNPNEKLLKIFASFVKYAVSNGIMIRAITGNHDTDGINHALESIMTVDSLYNELEITSDYPMFEVYAIQSGSKVIHTNEMYNINFVYVPWQPNIANVLIEAKKLKQPDVFNILITHCAVDGAVTNSDHEMKHTKVTKSILSGWDYVALGDFHTWQRVFENVYYSGDLVKLVWDERWSDKYFNVVSMDINGLKVKRVKLPDVNFIEFKVDYSSIDEYLSEEITEIGGLEVKNAFIRAYICGDSGLGDKIALLKRYLYKCGARDVATKIIKDVTAKQLNIDNTKQDIHLNLDIRDVCTIHLKNSGITDKNYKFYIDKKLAEIHG